MFVVINKKVIAWVLVCVLLAGLGLAVGLTVPKRASAEERVIVLDPGHGGYDAGCKGLKLGVKESHVNLSIALYAQAYLTDWGYKVVLTRTKDAALVSPTASYKRQDMDKRLQLIADENAAIVVSIHCNSYPSALRRGTQVFWYKDKDETLAGALQSRLNDTLNLPKGLRPYQALWGDYYLARYSPCPTAIVECGFLSNPEDEALLASEEYRMTVGYQIAWGIREYLEAQGSLAQ